MRSGKSVTPLNFFGVQVFDWNEDTNIIHLRCAAYIIRIVCVPTIELRPSRYRLCTCLLIDFRSTDAIPQTCIDVYLLIHTFASRLRNPLAWSTEIPYFATRRTWRTHCGSRTTHAHHIHHVVVGCNTRVTRGKKPHPWLRPKAGRFSRRICHGIGAMARTRRACGRVEAHRETQVGHWLC